MLGGLILLLVASAIVVFVTLLVCLASSVGKNLKLSFALVSSSLIFWQATVFVSENITTNLLFWNNLAFWGPTFALLGSYLFLRQIDIRSSVSLGRKGYGWLSVVAITALLQFIALLSGKIFVNVTYDAALDSYSYVRGGFYTLYIAGIALLIATLIIRLLVSYHKSKKEPDVRRAFKAVLVSIIAAMVFGFATNVVVPLLTNSDDYLVLGLLSMDIFALGLAFSIARHRFLDIRGYVFRAVTYVAALSLLTVLYVAITTLLVSRFLHGNVSAGAIVLQVLLTLLIAVSFNPLRSFFNRLTNKFFYRDYYDPQDLLHSLNSVLVATVDVEEICLKAQAIFESTIKPTFVRFMLYAEASPQDKDIMDGFRKTDTDMLALNADGVASGPSVRKALARLDADLAIRMQTKHEDLGYLILGSRRSGQSYSISECRLLSVAAGELAVGLQNALRFREIERFNLTLQQKIDEATKKLRKSNERLRLLDQTKDDFISMASHQLRTPLTSIKGYVSMTLDGDAGKLNEGQKKMLTQAFLSAQRMVYLISDLLNVSRLKTGKFVIEPVESNLAKVIGEELDQLTETVKSRGLELTYHKPEHFPMLMFDETKIRQVIMNLVDNAVYYTPNGGHIAVSLVEKPESIEFTVVDDGIGVPRHEQHHLFTKFYRAHNAKSARPDGTGLGLFMAKKVIIAQGGAIIFKSTEGKGSTFGFTFPKAALLPKKSVTPHLDGAKKEKSAEPAELAEA